MITMEGTIAITVPDTWKDKEKEELQKALTKSMKGKKWENVTVLIMNKVKTKFVDNDLLERMNKL